MLSTRIIIRKSGFYNDYVVLCPTLSMDISSITRRSYIYPVIMPDPKTNENIFRYLQASDIDHQLVESKCSSNSNDIDTMTFEEFNSRMKKKMCNSI